MIRPRNGWISPLAWQVRAEALYLYPLVHQRLAHSTVRAAVETVDRWVASQSRRYLATKDVGMVTGWAHGVGARLPWEAKCLDRSLVAWGILRRRDIPARIRLGWQKQAGLKQPEPAHAWIEVAGIPIHESPALVASLTAFADFDLGGFRKTKK